ncbi:unnamed protein product [Mytilus coruscus]|uniref:EGF-like domain-containing protein n=1 Tax=Mytilus coruscus TaxID=42192 RepID=A0A6J8E3E4_MYTCO|nr:unnamed protein product [Mytilus coruscus]
MYYNIVVRLLAIALSTDGVLLCSDNCTCSTTWPYIGQVKVNCSSKGLTVIPINFQSDSYFINMRYDSIITIEDGAFHNKTLSYYVGLNAFARNYTYANNINMINLDSLYLQSFCDCNIPFWSWLKSKAFTIESVTCFDRDNVLLSSLQASDFDNCFYNTCHPDYCSNGGSCSQDSYGDLICSCVNDWNDALCTG